jgi:putative membrane protein
MLKRLLKRFDSFRMSLSDFDPRVFFAAERTLLAWIRTGIAIIALGFVVARFGLFVELLATQATAHLVITHPILSAALGVTFILAGAFAIVLAAIQHRRFVARLSTSDLPPAYSSRPALAIAFIIAGLGVVLAGYLVIT